MDRELLRQAPKVLLHDHLDGGLRPSTIIELAGEVGYQGLPSGDPTELGAWFTSQAASGDLTSYLDTFVHTLAVMQEPEGIYRIAAECAQDLADDGIVYAEVRFAPELSTSQGLTVDEVMAAMLAGYRDGSAGRDISIGVLCTAMRQHGRGKEIAELAVRNRDRGVVGFDIAGPEAGYPPKLHLDAFHYLQRENFHFTIHAGEAYGVESIWEAIQICGAERLGHGVRIVDDIVVDDDGAVHLGPMAAYVRDRRIPLELCPTSNVHTGATPSIATHPFKLLADLRFRVTVNTDNRLMSNINLTDEFDQLAKAHGYGLDDIEWFTINAMKSSFLPFDQRLEVIDDVIKPRFEKLRMDLGDN